MCARRVLLNSLIVLLLWPSFRIRAEELEQPMAHHGLYFEVLGQGGLYSVNYEYRLARHWGLRGGFSQWRMPSLFLFVNGEMEFTGFPLMVNYLAGGGDMFLEVGIGAVPARVTMSGEMLFLGTAISGEETKVLGTATLGFRYQPWRGGLIFRVGLTPFTNFKESVLSGGVSFGYCF